MINRDRYNSFDRGPRLIHLSGFEACALCGDRVDLVSTASTRDLHRVVDPTLHVTPCSLRSNKIDRNGPTLKKSRGMFGYPM